MSGPNRQQRRSGRGLYVPAGTPLPPAEPDYEEIPRVGIVRWWHIGPKVDRLLLFANVTPNGCGLLLLVVATLAVVAMAAAAWLR